MHDVVFIQYLKGIQQLLEDEERILFCQLALLGQQTFESATIAILIDEVKII
jgi:hypothetical protein